jgi:competence protein ComEC
MPGAAILAVTGPLGLDQPGVWMIDYGSRWILAVAAEVATWPGAVSAVTVPPDAVLPLITLGGLWIILVQGRTRFAGLALPMVALALWTTATRPTVLISETGGLIGLMTDAGRTLSKPQGDGFAAESWLENDGEITLQEDAAMRPGLDTIARTTLISLNGATLLHVTGNTALAALDGCNGADILITNVEAEGLRPCEVYDITRLRNTGALAGRITEKGLTITTSAELTGQRLWSLAAQRRSVPETSQVEAQ